MPRETYGSESPGSPGTTNPGGRFSTPTAPTLGSWRHRHDSRSSKWAPTTFWAAGTMTWTWRTSGIYELLKE